jgi:hypothetical protein
MLDLGLPSALRGLALHFGVAFTWSAVFPGALRDGAAAALRPRDAIGVPAVAAVYGPAIWVVMSIGVIPLLTGHAAVVTHRWWIQLAGHVVFVGAPIVWGIRSGSGYPFPSDGRASGPGRPSSRRAGDAPRR